MSPPWSRMSLLQSVENDNDRESAWLLKQEPHCPLVFQAFRGGEKPPALDQSDFLSHEDREGSDTKFGVASCHTMVSNGALLYLSPAAAKTHDHNVRGLKQRKFILSQFWNPEV